MMRNQEKLTSNQEKYVQALLKGLTQRQAYYEAFPSSRKWSENSVDNKASVLFRSAKVRARYNELNEKMKEKNVSKAIYDTQQLREFWTSILTNNEEGIVNRLKASELLAKSQGAFIEKRESTIKASEDCIIRIAKNDN